MRPGRPHKPHSVVGESSIWDQRRRRPLAVYPALSTGRAAPLRLFHLAPDGVCLANDITAAAGALLPHLFTLTSRDAIRSLLHLPSGYPARPLAGIVTLWSADFPRQASNPPRFPRSTR